MSSEENKDEQQQQLQTSTNECKCTGWKVGFWLCFVCCIITFIVMIILFIKKRKVQEKVLPIVKSGIEKLKEKSNKVIDKGIQNIENKQNLIEKYKDVKNNNITPVVNTQPITPSTNSDSSLNLNNISDNVIVNSAQIQELTNRVDNLESTVSETLSNTTTPEEKGGKLLSIQELGF